MDGSERERIDDSSACDSAKEELHRMLAEDELRGAVLLVFANKHLPNVMSVNEVNERLSLSQLRNIQLVVQLVIFFFSRRRKKTSVRNLIKFNTYKQTTYIGFRSVFCNGLLTRQNHPKDLNKRYKTHKIT